MFLIVSMRWKFLRLLVCFELHRDDFVVKSLFGLPTIWLKPVPGTIVHVPNVPGHIMIEPGTLYCTEYSGLWSSTRF